MAKIDFKKQVFKNLADEPILKQDPTPEDPKRETQLSMAELIQAELLREDPSGTPTERFESYLLAKRIKASKGEMDLTIEELGTIKKISGKNPNPLVLGRIWDLLESIGEKESLPIE